MKRNLVVLFVGAMTICALSSLSSCVSKQGSKSAEGEGAETAEQVEEPKTLSAEEMFQMGRNYYYGTNGYAQDYGEAVKWYRKSAEQGDAWAQNGLGICYEYGRGVPQDYGEALKWYRKSAEGGYMYAQRALGRSYRDGRGVSRNFDEAAKWYRKAAAQGDEESQDWLNLHGYEW